MPRPGEKSARPCVRARHLATAAALSLLAVAGTAHADGPQDMVAARAAYDRGAAAYDRGEYAAAAADFARADELAPNPVALTHALKAAHRADEPVLGMTLVERSTRGPTTPELMRAVDAARARFASRVGQLAIRCPAALACRATIDGAPAAMGSKRWVTAGAHQVELIFEGGTERRTVNIVGGDDYEITPNVPPPSQGLIQPAPMAGAAASMQRSTAAVEADGSGISPAWFWVGAAVTVGLAGAATVSGIDALGRNSDYNDAPTADGLADGHAAETRTNVLIGASAAAAVGTAALGLFFVRWSGDGSRAAALTVTPTASGGGATLGLRGAL